MPNKSRTHTPESVIASMLKTRGKPETVAAKIVERLTDHGYRIVRYRLVDDAEVRPRKSKVKR